MNVFPDVSGFILPEFKVLNREHTVAALVSASCTPEKRGQ